MSDCTFISRRVMRMLRQILWAILVFILVTACSADQSQVRPVRRPDASQSAPSDTVRLVQHMMGETQVPINPQRVVTLGGTHLATALALGIQPIGSVTLLDPGRRTGLEPFEPYLRDRTQELTIVGHIEADLEKVLLLKPDLIMADGRHEAVYEQLSQIAPTVIYDYPNSWKDSVRFSGDVFGKPQAAEKVLNDYDQRTQELRQKLKQTMGENASDLQVSVIRPDSNGARLLYRDSFGGGVLEDVGLSRPPAQDKDGTNVPVSFELIPHMDGDVIFVISYDDDEADVVNELKNHPLWSQLEAVKQDKVYPVDGMYWYGWDILKANLILDDLFKYLLEEE